MTENQDQNPPRNWKVSIWHKGVDRTYLVGYYPTLEEANAKRDLIMKGPNFKADLATVDIIEAMPLPRSNRKINCLWA